MAKKTKQYTKRKKSTPRKKNKPKRKQTAREASSNPALSKRFYSKIKQEYFDYDETWLKQLPPKLQRYYNRFLEETLNARHNHSDVKLLKTKKARKASYDENNARNRDSYSQAKAKGAIVDISPEIAMEIWQLNYIDHDFETEFMKEKEKPEILTKREYVRLVDNGAIIPQEMQNFYRKLYKLE